jgi:4-aminobutyrate aminotransferase
MGYKIIEIIQRENLVQNAAKMGAYLLDGLRALQSAHPFLHDARGLGLMAAVSVTAEKKRARIIREAFQRGLLLLGCGFESIRFLPPLDVREREIDMALNILNDVMTRL